MGVGCIVAREEKTRAFLVIVSYEAQGDKRAAI